MSLESALLALLSSGPHSGYDLKKLLSESESLPWSGNNNQVYKGLIELHRAGLASLEVQQPAEGPARKVYSITPSGIESLRTWLLSPPEPPQLRSTILVRLAGSDVLDVPELETLLDRYAETVRLTLRGLEELQRRGSQPKLGSARQQLLWELIRERPLRLLRTEEEWISEVRWSLAKTAGRS